MGGSPDDKKNTSKIFSSESKQLTPPASAIPVPAVFIPVPSQPAVKKIVVSNAKDQQLLKALSKRVQDIEEKIVDLKVGDNKSTSGITELRTVLTELSQAMEKKAAVLELKKMNGYIDEINERNAGIAKEMNGLQKSVKSLEENEEVKGLKLKFASLDNKLNVSLKNLKELQTKVAENMGLQIIPQTQDGEEERKEERLKQFMDETNDKINGVKLIVQGFKKDFAKLSDSLNAKVDSKASVDSLIELESIS